MEFEDLEKTDLWNRSRAGKSRVQKAVRYCSIGTAQLNTYTLFMKTVSQWYRRVCVLYRSETDKVSTLLLLRNRLSCLREENRRRLRAHIPDAIRIACTS